MKYFKTILIIAFTIMLSSCSDFFKSEIDPPDISKETKIVVHSYISPDNDFITVSLKYSSPIFGVLNDDIKTINDAAIYISDSKGKKANIPYTDYLGMYSLPISDFPLEEGETYYIEVSTPDGKIAKSSCTIPDKIENKIKNIQIKDVEFTYEWDNEVYSFKQISFEFDDVKDEQNYYGAKYKVIMKKEKPEHTVSIEHVCIFSRFSDANRDGETIYVKSDCHNIFDINEVESLEITLYSLGKNYYEYHNSLESQETIEDNPFAEPIIIKSNIENGLGIFGAYSEKKVIINY